MSARREEAYYPSVANEKRSFRTCGHNEPKVSVKLIMSLQRVLSLFVENRSYAELT